MPGERQQVARAMRMKLFTEVPIWKSILIMGWPGILMMLITGVYLFLDTVFAINFANDSYATIDGIDGAHQVRMYTGAFAPISFVVVALSLLISIGCATRVSINLGRRDQERAKNTIRSGSTAAIIVSLVLIPILIFTAHPWMAGQMENGSANFSGDKIASTALDFAWIMISMAPFQFFNQLASALLRTEARNRQTLIAAIPPVLLNLLLDWVLMGPGHMGIEGAAWATFISTAITSLVLCYFIFKDRKHSLITLGAMFGKFKLVPLVGIILIGIAPFLRNMSQSITQTVEMHAMTSVGEHIYAAHGQMSSILIKQTFLGVAPIFNLFFPIMFGFIQGAMPISSFNYGAKNYARVKQTYWYSLLYAFIIGVLIWVLSSYAFGGLLLNSLGVHDEITHIASNGSTFNQYRSGLSMLTIVMSTSVFFSGAISGILLVSSTDRLLLSIISSSLRGIILFFPLVYLFRYLAENSSYEFAFWWFFPVIGFITSAIVTSIAIYTLRHLSKKEVSIDDRITYVYAWNARRNELKQALVNIKDKKARKELTDKYHQDKVALRLNTWTTRQVVPWYGRLLIKYVEKYKQQV